MQTVAVPSRIDVGNAVQVLESLRAATEAVGVERPALDLAPLQVFDSSALALLLQLVRDRSSPQEAGVAHPFGGQALLNPPRKLRALADLYGVEEILFGASAGHRDQAESA